MKISELPQAAEITGEELLPVVQNGETKKVSRDDFVGTVPDGIRIENGTVTLLSNGETVGESASLPEITVDGALSTTSENSVSNKVVTEALNGKLSDENGSVTEEKLSEEVKIKLNKPQIPVDSELSAESENPVQNKAIANSLSNAVKGKARGAILKISDISPITHLLKITAEGGNASDISNLKVRRYGKNQLDFAEIQQNGYAVPEITENGFILTGGYYASIKNVPVLPNTKYCLSYNTQNITGTTKNVAVFADNNTSSRITAFTNGTGGVFDSGECSTVMIAFYASSSNASQTVEFTDIQLELGTQQTEYEPYVPVLEAAVKENGTVEGLTSAYPNTVIVSDNPNVTLTCEYSKDLNKVIGKIIDAVVSMGGDV